MRRSLSSLFFTSLKRIGKVQQRQQKQLVKGLSAAASKVLKGATQSARKSAAKTARKPAAPAPQKSTSTPATPAKIAVLPGSFRRAFYTAPTGQRMTYWLYLPQRDSALAGQPLPLVVMLHGCTQTAPDFAQGTRMNALAQRKGFAVLYPQQLRSIDANRCWQWYENATQQGGGEAAIVAGLVAQMVARQQLDSSRVYVAGMSAGAALAQTVAMRYPQLVAAVAMHSGPVFGTADNRLAAFGVMQHGAGPGLEYAVKAVAESPGFTGMPALLMHGEADRVVRSINLVQLIRQFCVLNNIDDSSPPPVRTLLLARSGGRSPRHASQTTVYSRGRKPLVVACSIAGLDHAWSGGDPALRFNDATGPDASAMVWAFFARHRRLPG